MRTSLPFFNPVIFESLPCKLHWVVNPSEAFFDFSDTFATSCLYEDSTVDIMPNNNSRGSRLIVVTIMIASSLLSVHSFKKEKTFHFSSHLPLLLIGSMLLVKLIFRHFYNYALCRRFSNPEGEKISEDFFEKLNILSHKMTQGIMKVPLKVDQLQIYMKLQYNRENVVYSFHVTKDKGIISQSVLNFSMKEVRSLIEGRMAIDNEDNVWQVMKGTNESPGN